MNNLTSDLKTGSLSFCSVGSFSLNPECPTELFISVTQDHAKPIHTSKGYKPFFWPSMTQSSSQELNRAQNKNELNRAITV